MQDVWMADSMEGKDSIKAIDYGFLGGSEGIRFAPDQDHGCMLVLVSIKDDEGNMIVRFG